MKWNKVEDNLPEPLTEVLVIVDGHRNPLWRNNYPLVAYLNRAGDWLEERHPYSDPIIGVTHWTPISYPEFQS